MKVTKDKILLEVEKEEKSIIITNESQDVSDRATVIQVGKDIHSVVVGDKVIWNNRQGRFVNIDDKEYVLVDLHDIFIIL